jgi:P pilus assembly chaperone PapD
MRHGYLLSTLLLVTQALRLRHSYLLLTAVTAHAGVIINGTRLVYQGEKKNPLLVFQIQMILTIWCSPGWIPAVKTGKAPFLITPPLFRLNAKEDNVLRVVRTGGNLPEDRESLYWLNIKAIPSSSMKRALIHYKLPLIPVLNCCIALID